MIRPATIADLPGILAIYNEVIATSTAVYALEPVTLDERRSWFEGRQALGYPVLVASAKGALAGGACGHKNRDDGCSSWRLDPGRLRGTP